MLAFHRSQCMQFRKIRLQGVDLIHLAQDRDRWRTLVDTEINLWIHSGNHKNHIQCAKYMFIDCYSRRYIQLLLGFKGLRKGTTLISLTFIDGLLWGEADVSELRPLRAYCSSPDDMRCGPWYDDTD
jgi:hypothetical protein